MKPKLTLKERLAALKELESGKSSTQIISKYKISKALIYRLKKRFEKAKKNPKALAPQIKSVNRHPKLTPKQRLKMIEKVVKSGQKVTTITRRYGVSRTVFYRLLKRYRQAGNEEEERLAALENRAPIPGYLWRLTPAKVEKKILDTIAKYPELSVHKIVEVLPEINSKPLLSNKGVQNVLKRHNLGTFEQRLAFSKTQERFLIPSIPLEEIPAIPLKLWRLLYAPVVTIPKLVWSVSTSFRTFLTAIVTLLILFFWIKFILLAPNVSPVGSFFATTALTFGLLFFVYSLKYYLSAILVLTIPPIISTEAWQNQDRSGEQASLSAKIFQEKEFWQPSKVLEFILVSSKKLLKSLISKAPPLGLVPELSDVKLENYPFVSLHIPLYNEKKVAERILTATLSQEYPKDKFEIIVADDSTDETTQIASRFETENHPKVTVIHRDNREGFKGGALREALRICDPKAEYVAVFDADFIPFPDTISSFVKYFQLSDDNVAAVQGYQWHVLNKSENWITRGVRTEYAGSYVVERSATEIYQGLKMIAGSVYAIKKSILDQFGWGTSITEDFELTLRLYAAGYKVVYTPYVQTPAEAVSTVKRLVRQRMRWAEGHTFNIKKNVLSMMNNANLSFKEKFEFTYLAPYYLQAAFFIVGTLSWFISEAILHTRLPFWTATFGWSLVFSNFLSLPLVNTLGLFLEEAEKKDYLGILSFIALSYIVTPFAAYAAIKGLIEKEEGPWFRTPKSGMITDVISKIKLGFWWRRLWSWGSQKPAVATAISNHQPPFVTNYNSFHSFKEAKRIPWVSKGVLTLLLIVTVSVGAATRFVPYAQATNPSGTFLLYNDVSTVITATTSWQLKDTSVRDTLDTTTAVSFAKNAANGTFMQWQPGANNSTTQGTDCSTVGTDGKGWIFDTKFGDAGQIASGTWTFAVRESDDNSNPTGHLEVCVWRVTVSGGSISASTLLFSTEGMTGWPTTDMWGAGVSNPSQTTATVGPFNFNNEYLYVEYYSHVTADTGAGGTRTATFATGDVTEANDPQIVTPAVTIPEFALGFIAAAPFVPLIISLWIRKRKERLHV